MTEALDCAPWVQPALSLNVGGVSFFGRSKAAKMQCLAHVLYACRPLFLDRVVRGSYESRGANRCSRSEVLHIGLGRNIPKVCNSVIGRVPIHMVNVLFRPLAERVKPSQPVAVVPYSINPNYAVSVAVGAASHFPCVRPEAKLNAPCESATVGVVVKNFAQSLRGKIGLSHDAVLSQIGQRLAGVSAHGGLRYFNLEQA